jgi:hypothetical protein
LSSAADVLQMQGKLASKRAVVGDAERRAGGWLTDNIVGEPNAREQSKAIGGITITYLQMSAKSFVHGRNRTA